MRVVLAPQLEVHWEDRPLIPWSELLRYGAIDVSDDIEDTVTEVVQKAITDHGASVIGAEPAVDAPPYTTEDWWLATVQTNGNQAKVTSFELGDAFAIDEAGRVHFGYPSELSIAGLARAIDEGHYPTDERTLVVTRAGEFGGNGHGIESLVLWLLQEFPLILLGVRLDRALLRRDAGKQEELEQLAADWAGRQLLYPMSLKRFVESRNAWYPSVLAQRLALSDAAARRLVTAVGYEASPHDPDLFEYSDSPGALVARRKWDEAEWESTFTSLDELLESDSERPEVPAYDEPDLHYDEPVLHRPTSVAVARAWFDRLLRRFRG